jgi:pimeloyl-ACP methyl ester carboxylesterase/class 3 adenylate cyclase
VSDLPETLVTRSADGTTLAYLVLGSGPPNLVFPTPTQYGVPDIYWDEPGYRRTLTRLASFSRLIMPDPRGLGASEGDARERRAPGEVSDADLIAVMDAASAERAVLIGHSFGGTYAIHFAAAYPERVDALILIDTFAHYVREDDYGWGFPRERLDAVSAFIEGSWGNFADLEIVAPSRATDKRLRALWGRGRRSTFGPSDNAERIRRAFELDTRELLPSISSRTLVIHREGDRFIHLGAGRYLAEHIPGAKFVLLPGEDHLFFVGDFDALVDEIEEFVVGTRSGAEADTITTTVVFTDIVASTEHQARVGPSEWSRLTDQHEALVRDLLVRHRGREVKTIGDGFLATFDGTARGLRCAAKIVKDAQGLGLELRSGVHTGEVELRGSDIAGLAVTIAGRVCDLAGPAEVLVTRTVTDQVVGSGMEFDDRGKHQLKGVPGNWRLFAMKNLDHDANTAP